MGNYECFTGRCNKKRERERKKERNKEKKQEKRRLKKRRNVEIRVESRSRVEIKRAILFTKERARCWFRAFLCKGSVKTHNAEEGSSLFRRAWVE
jgi:hypothetical protein